MRYRAKYALDYAANELNVHCALVVPGYTIPHILRFLMVWVTALLFMPRTGFIVIQRVQSNFIYATLLKLLVRCRKRYTVYDLDDADYLHRPSKTLYWFVRNCHVVAAGSQ